MALLKNFGSLNMQGFSRCNVNAGYLVYDKMPPGYRAAVKRGLAGEDEASRQWAWVAILDERNGATIYTPLIADRNALVDDAPLYIPTAGGADKDTTVAQGYIRQMMEAGRSLEAAGELALKELER